METLYQLVVNIQTPKGMLEIGRFYLGTSLHFAESTFDSLGGGTDLNKYPSIRLDLLGTSDGGLPACLKSIGCNLDQYTANCRIITREVFRHLMFEDKSWL
jgi:hypothetical protein